jgi:DNA-binding NarL/FixJ family response regulator
MAGEQILIVDDDRTTASVMQLYLEKFGFVVTDIASSGADAIDKIRNQKPDLILMDINLGKGLDGIDTADVIMNNFHIPVVYVTSHSDDKTLERAKETNAYGYINKPLRDTDLKTTIRLALDKNKETPKEKELPSLEETLHKIYNLTPAESRVVSQLLDNPDVELASEALHISISTIRTHLKHIYRKTDTNNQMALFHKIITGPAKMMARSE